MDASIYWFVGIGIAIVVGLLACIGWFARRTAIPSPQRARELFQHDLARLHARFLEAAAATGKPRGLRWKECQWSDAIEWLRDKQSGQLLALVGVTITFEAIAGSDMEGVEAVDNLRNASAVFYFENGIWQTAGRTIFNLNPDEAVAHFQQGYDRLDQNR